MDHLCLMNCGRPACGFSQRPRPAQAAVRSQRSSAHSASGARGRQQTLSAEQDDTGTGRQRRQEGIGRPLGTVNLLFTFLGDTDQVAQWFIWASLLLSRLTRVTKNTRSGVRIFLENLRSSPGGKVSGVPASALSPAPPPQLGQACTSPHQASAWAAVGLNGPMQARSSQQRGRGRGGGSSL